jgi:hypothetical protein
MTTDSSMSASENRRALPPVDGLEVAAKVVEKETEAPAQRNAKSMWVQDIGDRLATAIRQQLEGK